MVILDVCSAVSVCMQCNHSVQDLMCPSLVFARYGHRSSGHQAGGESYRSCRSLVSLIIQKNILVKCRRPLSVKVSDFGLAKIVDGGTALRVSILIERTLL